MNHWPSGTKYTHNPAHDYSNRRRVSALRLAALSAWQSPIRSAARLRNRRNRLAHADVRGRLARLPRVALPFGWRLPAARLSSLLRPLTSSPRTSSATSSSSSTGRLARAATAASSTAPPRSTTASIWSAPEYQLLDDINAADNASRLTSAGSAVHPRRGAGGTYEAGRRVETPRASSPRAPRGALAQRFQAARVRTGQRGLGREGQGDQVRSIRELRPRTRGQIGIQGDHVGSLELRNVRSGDLRRHAPLPRVSDERRPLSQGLSSFGRVAVLQALHSR